MVSIASAQQIADRAIVSLLRCVCIYVARTTIIIMLLFFARRDTHTHMQTKRSWCAHQEQEIYSGSNLTKTLSNTLVNIKLWKWRGMTIFFDLCCCSSAGCSSNIKHFRCYFFCLIQFWFDIIIVLSFHFDSCVCLFDLHTPLRLNGMVIGIPMFNHWCLVFLVMIVFLDSQFYGQKDVETFLSAIKTQRTQ